MDPYRKIKAIQNNVEIMKRETPCRNCRKIPNEYSNKMSILVKCFEI
jgi:cytidine deaminase